MRKAIKWLDLHFEETILVFLLACIACVELAQVIIRNVPFIPALTWAEEFCRFCWIASVFISLPYTIRMASMLRVTVLVDALPETARKVVNIAVDLVNALVMGFLGYYSVGVVQKIMASGETSPAMLWPMWALYAVMMCGFILGCFRGLQQAWFHIRHFHDKDLSSAEKVMAEAAEEAEAGRRAERIGEQDDVEELAGDAPSVEGCTRSRAQSKLSGMAGVAVALRTAQLEAVAANIAERSAHGQGTAACKGGDA